MFASVTGLQIQSGKVDDAARAWSENALPLARKQKGFQSANFLVDRNTGKGYVVGFWESEADAKAFETSGAFKEAVAKLAAFISGQPVREVFDLVAKSW